MIPHTANSKNPTSAATCQRLWRHGRLLPVFGHGEFLLHYSMKVDLILAERLRIEGATLAPIVATGVRKQITLSVEGSARDRAVNA